MSRLLTLVLLIGILPRAPEGLFAEDLVRSPTAPLAVRASEPSADAAGWRPATGPLEPAGSPGSRTGTANDVPPTPEAPEGPGPRRLGPLRLRSLDALSLLLHQATLEPAETLPAGRGRLSAELQYASLETFSSDRGYFAIHDLETLRLELLVSIGLTDDLELGFGLPFLHSSSGFLDDFIDDFHEATGLGAVRDQNGLYTDVASYRGQPFAGLEEDGFDIGDAPVTLRYALWHDGADPLAVAVRAGLEFPTGDEERGFGSGVVEGSLGLLAQKTLGDCTFYLSLDGIFQDNPRRFEEIGIRAAPALFSTGFAIEWELCRWLIPVAQVRWSQPALEGGRGHRFDRDRAYWAIGCHVPLGDAGSLRCGLQEDFGNASVPDVTFVLGITAEL